MHEAKVLYENRTMFSANGLDGAQGKLTLLESVRLMVSGVEETEAYYDGYLVISDGRRQVRLPFAFGKTGDAKGVSEAVLRISALRRAVNGMYDAILTAAKDSK